MIRPIRALPSLAATAVAALQATGLAAAGRGWVSAAQAPEFRAGVDLVRLSVTARDLKGDLVHDLRPVEIQVFEDGMEQEVVRFGHHETPISAIVLFDRSGSMRGEKLMHAKDAVAHFVGALGRQDEALVIAFSDSIAALGGFGLGRKTIERAVEELSVESATRLYDAVLEGAKAIAGPGRKEKRAIVILSDGEDTASQASLEDAVEAVRAAGAPVYAIGIELGSPWSFPGDNDRPWVPLRAPAALDPLERLTRGTGGSVYSIAAARRCKQVCLRVAEELRNQYLLGYSPHSDQGDGRWRTIAVRTTRPGVTLVTRSGYYAQGPAR